MRMPTIAGLAAAGILLAGSLAPALAGTVHVNPWSGGQPDSQSRIVHILKQQIAGKLHGPVPRAALQYQLNQLMNHARVRPFVAHPDKKGIGLWATDTNNSYLIGMNSKAKKTMLAINTEDNGCNYPVTVKVDGSGNVWPNCEYNSDFTAPGVQEYSSAGTLLNTFNYNGCPNPSQCEDQFGYGFDAAFDSGHAYAALNFGEYCDPSCVYGGGYIWWNTSNPSANGNLVFLPYDNPVEDVYYMDADGNGNLWVDFEGCNGSDCGYGVGEVQNATSGSPTFVTVLQPGSLGFPGGVYVSNGGNTLNVIDQDARTISQYSLPSFSLVNTLGPTYMNFLGQGDPVSGGFNQGETMMAIGDAYSWLDIGTLGGGPGTWKAVQNTNLVEPEGAAYNPSDK